jgi:large subunit ribosomal protein L3
MTLGLVGRKVGMTRLFTDAGDSVPVTVLDVSGNRVTQIKTEVSDGYSAVQVAFGSRRPNRINKAQAGHFAKAGVEGARGMREFRVNTEQLSGLESKGKGFSGAIKRHNFSSQRASHGNSVSHNAPGSTGQNQDPGRVFAGKRMAGQHGSVRRTVQNLQVVRIDEDRSLLLVRGPVPGADGSDVVVLPAVKAKG